MTYIGGTTTFRTIAGRVVALVAAIGPVSLGVNAADATTGTRPTDEPITLGVLPVASSVEPAYAPLRTELENAIDVTLGGMAGVQLVERGRIVRYLDELGRSQVNRGDLKLGQIVGAEVLVRPSLVTRDGAIRLDIAAIETATGNVLHRVEREIVPRPPAPAQPAARRAVAPPAPGAKTINDAGSEMRLAVAEFAEELSAKLKAVRRVGAVDVALLPINFDSPLGADAALAEGVRRRLADHLTAAVPKARVLQRDLAEFVVEESRLAAGGLVDPERRFAPVAGAVLVEGKLTQTVAQGKPLAESILTLAMTVRRGETAKTFRVETTLKDAGTLEAKAATELATVVAALTGDAAPAAGAPGVDDRDRRRWEAQQYLMEAKRLLKPWGVRQADRTDEQSRVYLDLCAKAAALMPESPQPYETVWLAFMGDLPGAARPQDRRPGVSPETHPARVLRRQFVDAFPDHPLWPSAVMCELNDLGPRFPLEKVTPEAERAWQDLARGLADAILGGRAKLNGGSGSNDAPAMTGFDPSSVLASANAALFSAGEIDRAWEMTMAAAEQVDAPRPEAWGWNLVDDYIYRALQTDRFDAAWRAAQYLRANYPEFQLIGLEATWNQAKTPLQKLKDAGLVEQWKPFIESAQRRQRRQQWLSTQLQALSKTSVELGHEIRVSRGVESSSPATALAKTGFVATHPPANGPVGGVERGVIASMSSEGLTGADALRPWCVLYNGRRPERPLLWRVGSSEAVELDGVPLLEGQGGAIPQPPRIVSFGDALFSTSTSFRLYRIDPATGKGQPVVDGLPKGLRVYALIAHAGALYAAGGGAEEAKDAAGFVARLDAGATEWRVWLTPKGTGPVTQLLGATPDGKGGTTLRAFCRGSQQLLTFAPDAPEPWRDVRPMRRPYHYVEELAITDRLCLQLIGSGMPMFRWDPAGGAAAVETLYWPHVMAGGQGNDAFWRPMMWRDKSFVKNTDPAALPLAGTPMGVASDPTEPSVVWVLDRRGGLTAYDPHGNRTAGPFMVAPRGVSLTRAQDAGLLVNGGETAVVVPADTLRAWTSDPKAWRSPGEVYDDLSARLDRWAATLPPVLRGVLLGSVGRPDLGEKAFAAAGETLPVESLAYRIERAGGPGNRELAMSMMKPYIDDPSKLDDKEVERTILVSLEYAKRWDVILDFVPRLWLESPLRGANVPYERVGIYYAAVQHAWPREEAKRFFARAREGELPKAAWSWDENTTYRCMARQFRWDVQFYDKPPK